MCSTWQLLLTAPNTLPPTCDGVAAVPPIDGCLQETETPNDFLVELPHQAPRFVVGGTDLLDERGEILAPGGVGRLVG